MDSWSPATPGELSTQSEEFRTRWAAHNVRLHQTGAKHVHHPVVGDLSLTFEMPELRADPGLTILTYTAEPGSKSEEALNLLGSWAATLDQAEPSRVTEEACSGLGRSVLAPATAAIVPTRSSVSRAFVT